MAESKSNVSQDVETLRQRYESLNAKKITAEANLATSTQRLEDLKEEAREKYGADDLETLRAKLETMKQDNERRRAEYQQHLDSIEAELGRVESEHAAFKETES